jgi:GR25 family glycosyltransferase involved in LPS biosynthesis
MITIKDTKIADIGFYINLDKRLDRKSKIEQQLLEYHILGIDRHNANCSTDSGPTNCKLSHYEVYEQFLSSNKELLLVLEDDCLFLPHLITQSKQILENIFAQPFDLFWLGCRNRRTPRLLNNRCYITQSVSHAQSYLINRKLCSYIVEIFPKNIEIGLSIDELLCLIPYGEDVVRNPNKYQFYTLDNPIDILPLHWTSLCYESALTTQYRSYSDLWRFDSDVESYITSSYPVIPANENY